MLTAAAPALAPYRDVGDHAALTRAGLFVAEGRLVVERLLHERRFRVQSALVTPAAAQALAAVFETRPDVPVLVCEPDVLREVTGFNFHRGCLALAHRPDATTGPDLRQARRILAIDGVGNPDNIGGLFRSAFALGAGGVVLDETAGDPLYRKAIRTSMGATLRLPYLRDREFPASLLELRRAGVRVVALTPDPAAVPLDQVERGGRMAIVVGSEGHGLRARTLAAADVMVRIPVDARADSLNVAVAAAIALHALGPG